jgi:hypothetical protein
LPMSKSRPWPLAAGHIPCCIHISRPSCSLGGNPLRLQIGRLQRCWVYFVLFGRCMCLAVCFMRLAYATGPAFLDLTSCLSVVMFHIVVYVSPGKLLNLLYTERMLSLLRGIRSSARLQSSLSESTTSRESSPCTSTIAAFIGIYVAFLPLFFDAYYLHGESWDFAFGLTSGALLYS